MCFFLGWVSGMLMVVLCDFEVMYVISCLMFDVLFGDENGWVDVFFLVSFCSVMW